MSVRQIRLVLILFLVLSGGTVQWGVSYGASEDNPAPPESPLKLIFVHHSCGENWLADEDGGLGIALRNNNYFVSDTNYEWGPDCPDCIDCPGSGAGHVGNCTDIVHWENWFSGANSETILNALYNEFGQHSWYARRADPAPARENEIVLFKSCYPNSNLGGEPDDSPAPDVWLTVGRAKFIYNCILEYFATCPDKLFVVVTAPPVTAAESWESPANARAFNDWLVNEWLKQYPYDNVAVFDFYNVLTSNGGNAHTNDLGQEAGNHHRWWNGAVQHSQTVDTDYTAYGSGDSHPTPAGNRKATAEFIPLLNIFVNRWRTSDGVTQPPSPSPREESPEASAFTPPALPESMALPAGEHTFVLQHGVSPEPSYAGTTDVILASDAEPNANLGGAEHLEVFFCDVEYRRTLIRFDLSILPVDITVNGARLELYRHGGDAPSAMQVEVYCLTRGWLEGTHSDFWPGSEWVPDGATWITAAPGVAWAIPGGDVDTTTDYGHGPNGVVDRVSLPGGNENGWVGFDVTAAVRAWLEENVLNYGLLLRPYSGEYTYHYFTSRDSQTVEERPRLVLTIVTEGE